MPVSLVTGGAGFMGAHVAEHLLRMGHRVVVLDDLSGGFPENVPEGATFVEGSILDHALISRLFEQNSFNYVYHLGAYAAEGLSHFIKRFNYNNNLIGSINLINASVNHGVECFVFTSSIAVYGAGQTPMAEEMTPIPEDSYGISKLAVEQELRVSHEMFGLEYVIFRPHNVYGEKQNIGDRYRNVVGIFMNQLLKSQPMTIFGDGTQERAFTHIDDVAPIIAASVTIPAARNEVFNVGADVPYSVNELARVVAKSMGVECKVKHLEPRNEVKMAFSDHSKAERVFGQRKKTSLEDGVRAMAEWVKKQGVRESRIFEEIEIAKNMPPSWAKVMRAPAVERAQHESNAKPAGTGGVTPEITNLRAKLDQSEKQIKDLEEKGRQLTCLWSKSTRWKRSLVFLALAPLVWAVGCVVCATEIAARLLRKFGPRRAPLVAPADTSRCSIIVLSWEGKDLLAQSLPPLLKAVRFHGGDHEIIVMDNGSTDGTSEYVEKNFPEVRVVRSDRNLFFSGGNNFAVDAAKNDIVILLNNDMFVREDFLGPLLEGFRGPDVFAVASQVFLADPKQRREETGKTRATFNGCDLDWAHDPILPSDEEQRYVPVFWGHGGAVALDRQKYLWLGGLDNLFAPLYVEDSDLSYRAWKVGWRCMLAVHSHVVHKHRGTLAPRVGSNFVSQIVRRNTYLFIWKNFGDFGKLLKHFLRSPRRRMQRAATPGVGIRLEARAFLGAVGRLPAVLKRKLSLARAVVRNHEQILQLISTPQAKAIRESEVDFARGDCAEQLGEGWYAWEQANGGSFRWTSERATLFLRAPAVRAELRIAGHVSGRRRSVGSSVVLTMNCQGEQKRFKLPEGAFEQRYSVTGLTPGLPVAVELTTSPVLVSPTDRRTLGVIVNEVGLSPQVSAKDAGHWEVVHPVSIRNPSPAAAELPEQRKVLMVCAYLPCLGVHSGGNTMFNLIRTLSKRHRLTVLSFYENEAELEHVKALSPCCQQLEVIYRGQSLNAANPFGLKPPEIVYDFYNKRMWRLVEDYLRTCEYDLIQCEYLQTAHYASIDPKIPAVLTNHELLSLAYLNRYQNLSWISGQKYRALISWMRMLNYEEKMLRRFSGVVVLTPPEREFLARYAPQARVYDHPTGVDCGFFSSTGEEPEAGTLVFVGNFRHTPNVIGITWFLKHTWPKIRARYTKARLNIVGANPPAALQELHGQNGVTVTGWVEDIRPFLQQASVFVAPIFDGVGLRGKILEAWAMEKPVVGTRLAFQGLTNSDGTVCLMADDPECFAARTCELLENRELARNMGRQARQLVLCAFSWDAFGELYERIYRDVLSPKDQWLLPAGSTTMELQRP